MKEKIKLALILKSLEMARRDGLLADTIWMADEHTTLFDFILIELDMEMGDGMSGQSVSIEKLNRIIKGED